MAQGRITDKQKEILEFIKACILKKGYPPTVREICEKVQLKSTSSVHSHLEQLEKNGYIHRDPTKPRAIEIVDDTFNLSRRELVNVPLIGTVAAGAPILADENVENYFPIPAELLPNSETFMLKVRGNSMIDVGIYDGDRVIVEQTSVAENGEIVVALIDDSATVKRFFKENGHYRLQPENATTYSNYYKNEKELEAVLTGLQVYLRQAVGEFTGGDISRAGEILDYDRSSRKGLTLSNVGTWKYYYYTIYQANLILENTHRFKGDPEKLKPYIQQAYFAKAVAYFYLAMNYGQVPITGSTIEFSKFPQSPISSVLDEAEKWGLKAMDLPTYEDLVATSKESRMKQYGSKGAAAALLAHLYAWRAGVEGKKECWAKAEEYCTMLIEGKVGSYSLAADPETVCTSVMKGGSAESIWEIYYDSQEGLRTDLPITFPIALGSAHPINNQYSDGYYKSTVRMMYAPEDLRRDAYFWNIDADSLFLIYKSNAEVYAATEHKPGDSIVAAEDNQKLKRAFLYKFRYAHYIKLAYTPELQFAGINQYKVIWRLGEIYLLRAECRARQGKTNAVDDLNEIRRRAYGDDMHAFPNSDDVEKGLSGNIQLAIFREREKELVAEYHRYFDIMRNGWCFLRGDDTHDYIRKEISEAYDKLTDRDIQDGALYLMLGADCFSNNDLIRQNRYWNRRSN